jgi:hypothetical protein
MKYQELTHQIIDAAYFGLATDPYRRVQTLESSLRNNKDVFLKKTVNSVNSVILPKKQERDNEISIRYI